MAGGLTQALIRRREIEVPDGGAFSVRGLTAEDAFVIYADHAGELGLWFEKLQSGTGDVSLDAAPVLAASILKSAPGLCAEIIAAACDAAGDPESIAIARQLPIGVQAMALEAVAEMTFTQEMPPKKLMEIVVRMMSNLTSPTPGEN